MHHVFITQTDIQDKNHLVRFANGDLNWNRKMEPNASTVIVNHTPFRGSHSKLSMTIGTIQPHIILPGFLKRFPLVKPKYWFWRELCDGPMFVTGETVKLWLKINYPIYKFRKQLTDFGIFIHTFWAFSFFLHYVFVNSSLTRQLIRG